MNNPRRILYHAFARARVPDLPEVQALFRPAQPKVLAVAKPQGNTPASFPIIQPSAFILQPLPNGSLAQFLPPLTLTSPVSRVRL